MLLLEKVWRMANDPDPDIPASVTTGEVRVGKAFEADRFPVPAIAFEIESLADEPIRIRLVDDIPESFPMEGVGFHPDYEGDNWTAYRDNRVAYERTLEPGESILTVYGIRIDDPEEADDFLGDPEIELIEHGDAAATGDVLGRETTQVVRDALSGDESGGLSGLGTEPLLDDDVPAPAPRGRIEDPITVTGDRDESVAAVGVEGADAEAEAEAEEPADEDANADDDADEDADTDDTVPSAEAAETLDPRTDDEAAATEGETEAGTEVESASSTGEDTEAEADADAESDDATAPAPASGTESIAAALAAEIRAGTVDDDDLSVLQEAFEAAEAGTEAGAVPTSVDVRIGRLQSQLEDLLAYRDALADFLDENGTAEEVVGEVSEELTDLSDRVASLEAAVADADDERADLDAELATVTDRVDDVADRLDTVADDLDELTSTAETIEERLEAVEDIESDIEDIEDELDDLQSFRDRLSSAFGSGEG
jgi:archaellum component FlaC